MKSTISTFKTGLFILFILTFSIKAFTQPAVIYQTGFESFPDSTMLGKNVAYAAAVHDGWLVNDSIVQKSEANAFYCFAQLGATDQFRNCWSVSDAWHYQPFGDSNTTTAKAIRPISHKTLAMTGFFGANGTITFENEYCISGLIHNVANGFMDYFTNLVTNRWAYRVIPSSGYTGITVNFNWRCMGQSGKDYGQVGYSTDGGTSWTWIVAGATSLGLYYGQQINNQFATVNLPPACDNQNTLAIGFRFICAGSGPDQDLNNGYPSFAVDNVVVKGTPTSGSCISVSISKQPVSAPACNPGTGSLSVSTLGDGPISYQWQILNGTWSNVNAATSSTYSVTNPTTTNQYRCIASNCSAPVVYATSNTATLSIAKPLAIDPAFETQERCNGESVGYTIHTTDGTGPFTYQWLLNGSPVTNAIGTNSLYYNNNGVNSSDNGTYSCVVSNACNSKTGNIVTLSVIICNRTHHKITGYVRYANAAKTPMSSFTSKTFTNVYLFNLGDTLISKVQTDDNGYYEFVDIINGTYYVTGSTNKPLGGENATDALIVNRYFVGLAKINDTLWFKAGDVDSTSVKPKLNSTDALAINRRFVGLIKKYPNVKDWKFEKIKVNVSVDISQDLRAECSGDVNGSYSAIPSRIMYSPLNNSGSMNISSGKQFDIPVFINDNNIGAFGLKLKTNDPNLKIIDIHSDNDGLIYNIENNQSTENGTQSTDINVAWAANNNEINITPDKPVFTVKAIYTGNQNPETLLISPESEIADNNINIISNEDIVVPKLILNNTLPSSFLLFNHPNPFNNITNIDYKLPEDLNVKINVYNVMGEKVTSLINGNQKAGQYTVKFDGSNLKQGIYYCKIEATNKTSSYTKTDIMMIAR